MPRRSRTANPRLDRKRLIAKGSKPSFQSSQLRLTAHGRGGQTRLVKSWKVALHSSATNCHTLTSRNEHGGDHRGTVTMITTRLGIISILEQIGTITLLKHVELSCSFASNTGLGPNRLWLRWYLRYAYSAADEITRRGLKLGYFVLGWTCKVRYLRIVHHTLFLESVATLRKETPSNVYSGWKPWVGSGILSRLQCPFSRAGIFNWLPSVPQPQRLHQTCMRPASACFPPCTIAVR